MFTHIAVLGAGTMGTRIAKFFVYNKVRVSLYDPNEKMLSKAKFDLCIHESLQNYLYFEKNLKKAVSNADLIIESVPENLEIKQNLYEQLTPIVKEGVVICSNTSSFSLASLSNKQVLESQMIITHFFNPADIIPLVEIVQSEKTKEGICDQIVSFFKSCGKVPVVLRKDCKGFIANRLQAAVLREACFLLENGIADASDIDKVMVEGIGFRWAFEGPFSITDQGGLDIWGSVCENLLPNLCDSKQVPTVLKKKIENNEFGIKNGIGFYNYADINMELLLKKRQDLFHQLIHLRSEYSVI